MSSETDCAIIIPVYKDRMAFTENCLYQYYVYIKGRVTATNVFGGDCCKGQFSLYNEGCRLVEHFKKMNFSQNDIERFRVCIQQHLDSGVFGEIVNGIPISKLSFGKRHNYIKRLLIHYGNTNGNGRGQCNDFATKIIRQERLSVLPFLHM